MSKSKAGWIVAASVLVLAFAVGGLVGKTTEGRAVESRPETPSSARALSTTSFGLPVAFSGSCETYPLIQTTVATNASGVSAAAWICADGTVQVGLESAGGSYSGPFDVGMGDTVDPTLLTGRAPVPDIGIDSAGDVLVVWGGYDQRTFSALQEQDPTPYEAPVQAAFMASGQTFGPPVQLSYSDDASVGQLAMNSIGDALLTFTDYAGSTSDPSDDPVGTYYDIMRAGGRFSPPVSNQRFSVDWGGLTETLGDTGYPAPSVALNDAGDAIIGFSKSDVGAYVSVMENWGDFGAPINLSPFYIDDSEEVEVAIDAAGDALALNLDSIEAYSNADGYAIWVSTMMAGTGTFTSPIPFQSGSAGAFSLAMNPTGDVLLSSIDYTGTADVLQVQSGTVTGTLNAPLAIASFAVGGPLTTPHFASQSASIDSEGNGLVVWDTEEDCITHRPSSEIPCPDAYAQQFPVGTLTSEQHVPNQASIDQGTVDFDLVASRASDMRSSIPLATGAAGISAAAGGSGRAIIVWAGKSCSESVIQAVAAGQVIHGILVKSGTLRLRPKSGTVGSSVKTKGKLSASSKITYSWDGTTGVRLGQATTSTRGRFGSDLHVPAAPDGEHTVIAEDGASGCAAIASYKIKPSLAVTPKAIETGTQVTVTLSGFGSDQVVALHWQSPSGPAVGTASTNADGSATTTFTVPAVRVHRYTVVAVDADGATGTADLQGISNPSRRPYTG